MRVSEHAVSSRGVMLTGDQSYCVFCGRYNARRYTSYLVGYVALEWQHAGSWALIMDIDGWVGGWMGDWVRSGVFSSGYICVCVWNG